MNRFVERFTSSIVSVLGCHDRVIFRGHLPFGGDEHLNRFVDYALKIKRKDFLPFLEPLSESLVDHAKQLAQQANAPYHHFEAKPDKEKLIHKLLREKPHDDGLVAVLCCKEHCRTVKLLHGNQRPRLAFRPRPQRVLYFYFLDPDFGLMYVRVQTLFPFTAQIYVNGHEWLARQLHKQRIGFVQADNAFVDIDDFDRAQELADQFSKLNWVKILDRFVQRVNPLLKQPWLGQRSYRWVIDQAEFSTDLLFLSKAALAKVYPVVQVVAIERNKVRLGVVAPPEIPVHREEVLRRNTTGPCPDDQNRSRNAARETLLFLPYVEARFLLFAPPPTSGA